MIVEVKTTLQTVLTDKEREGLKITDDILGTICHSVQECSRCPLCLGGEEECLYMHSARIFTQLLNDVPFEMEGENK